MRITRARLLPYRLPLRRPWRSARGELRERSGWLIELQTESGLTGQGDCAPLPEAGTETPATALACLQRWVARLPGLETEAALHRIEAAADLTPAARCGVETALLDLAACAAHEPLTYWLSRDATLAVPVNAVLGALDTQVGQRAAAALAQGFDILKLKVGLYPMAQELAQLHQLATALPHDAALRLDANGRWSEAEARIFLAELATLPVESVEEPLAVPNPDALARLQKLVPFPLALDESLRSISTDTCLQHHPVHRLILKPMVLGGPRLALALARRAYTAGLECVVTTTVDSAVGVRAAAHLAGALNNGLAHGLATSTWLQQDVGPPPGIEKGILRLEDMPGLGLRGLAAHGI